MEHHERLGDRPGWPDQADHGDAMSAGVQETVIVAGISMFTVRVGSGDSDRSMSVTITSGGRTQWTYTQPAWRPLAYGYDRDCTYIWSARAIIVLPTGPGDDPDVLDVDEDLLLVFRIEPGWLLVCETSVRLIAGKEETSRMELGDVVEQVRWESGDLVVEDANGATARIRMDGRSLST